MPILVGRQIEPNRHQPPYRGVRVGMVVGVVVGVALIVVLVIGLFLF